MNSNIWKVLCKDCLASVLGLIIVGLVIISVAMGSVASQYRGKNPVSESELRRSQSRNEEAIKNKNMEIEELVRSGEILF